MSFAGSDIQLTVEPPGGSLVDLSNHATIAGAKFDISAGAVPGMATVALRDMDRTLLTSSFPTGSRLRLRIDDQPMWGGFALRRGRTSFFPAGDGKEDTAARQFVLYGVDNNILLDKRVVRRTSNYLAAIPTVVAPTYDGDLLKTMLSSYADMPGWLDISSMIDNVYQHPDADDLTQGQGWAYVEQGSRLRAQFEDLAAASGAVYYIGPDEKVHYHALQSVESPWGFSDRPNHGVITGSGGFEGAYWGFHRLNADEDGSQFATDAFVWGGSPFASSGTVVFHRSTDTDLEALHGKWQISEQHFNQTNFKTTKTVTQRANVIVFGNPAGTPGDTGDPGSALGEGPRGLRYPQWSYAFDWMTKDVPSISGVPRHLYPGDIVPIQLWGFSEDDGVTPFTKLLPLRSLSISFPSGAKDGKAHVSFTGTFDLRNEDPFTLWRYLRKREPTIITQTVPPSGDGSSTYDYGSTGRFTPTPAPDGVTDTFTLPVGYVPGTLDVYMKMSPSLGGVLLRRGVDFVELDTDGGTFQLLVSPLPDAGSGDWLSANCVTLSGTAATRTIDSSITKSEFLALCNDFTVSVIQMQGGTYAADSVSGIWDGMAVDVDRTGFPLSIVTVDGDVTFDGTGAHHPSNGCFVFGFASPTNYVTFRGTSGTGYFRFENYEVQQGGLVATVDINHFEFSGVRGSGNSCYGGTSTHTEWALYFRSNGTDRPQDNTFDDWDIDLSFDSNFNGFQLYDGDPYHAGPDNLTWSNLIARNGNEGFLVWGNGTGVDITDCSSVSNNRSFNASSNTASDPTGTVTNFNATGSSIASIRTAPHLTYVSCSFDL